MRFAQLLLFSVICVTTACASAGPQPRSGRAAVTRRPMERPIIIAHRGASGYRPEHTLAAYELAIVQGADFIEPDLVPTQDGVLVARHENEISGTTDVAERFPTRRRRGVIDGDTISGWFIEDFTLAEVRTLRAVERLPLRDHAFDRRFAVPTLDEVLALVRRMEQESGRTIGVYPETKHPTYFAERGLALEEPLLRTLARHGYRGRDDAVFIQSFETANLRAMRRLTTIRLVQLVDEEGGPYDLVRQGDRRGYRALVHPDGLREVATYADAVAVNKHLILPLADSGRLGAPTSLVQDAHAAGLEVHVWTLRSDAPFLPPDYGGDAGAEWRQFAALGVDGIFGDFPDAGVRALRSKSRDAERPPATPLSPGARPGRRQTAR